MVNYFIAYNDFDKSKLPVLWDQTLLCYIQYYKLDLTKKQKMKLKDLILAYVFFCSDEVLEFNADVDAELM